MAGIEKRTGPRGTTYRVYWREGGGRAGARDSETCDDKGTARRFKGLVEAGGERRPGGYPKGCRGLGTGDPAPQGPAKEDADSEASRPRGGAVQAVDAPTLGEVIGDYLAWLTQTGKAEARQVAGYRRLSAAHVCPAVPTVRGEQVGPLGGIGLLEVTTEIVQAWVTWMGERTHTRTGKPSLYSPKTIANVHGSVISPALAWAARNPDIPLGVNPCIGVILPKRNRRVTLDEVPTGEEIAEWIKIAYMVSQVAGDIVVLALGAGLRWSEMTALRPCDIDLKRKTLRVSQVVKERGETRELYIADYGKSSKALRTLRIGDEVVRMLARRMEGVPRKALLFPGARGGIFRAGAWHRTHWSKVVKLARAHDVETRATAHKLRHAHAVALLGKLSLDTVSKRLGHSSIVITADTYGHLDPGMDGAAADLLDAAMRADKPKKKPKKKAKKAKKERKLALVA